MKQPCNVILDLLPLVKDGVASEESTELVYEHMKTCENCRAEFELFQTNEFEQLAVRDEKIISAIKRSVFITQLSLLIAGAIFGIVLTNSIGMFYNLLIMPIVGALSIISLKKKAYLAPIAIFFVTFIWQAMLLIASEEMNGMALAGGLTFSMIYSVLVCLGMMITMLLTFAFKREEGKNEK